MRHLIKLNRQKSFRIKTYNLGHETPPLMPPPHPLIGNEKLGLWLKANFVHKKGFEP